MAKWVKFTDIDSKDMAYVRFIDLDKVVAFSVLDEAFGAELDVSGGECIRIRESYAIQAFERYFTAKSVMVEKLEGKQDVL